MSSIQIQKGYEVEQKAVEWFLETTQARLLVRNYRCRWGEIDFICEEKEDLVIVEVRFRHFTGWVSGIESITLQKKKRLMRTAQHFLSHYSGKMTSIRFDLLVWDGQHWIYMPNAWSCDGH